MDLFFRHVCYNKQISSFFLVESDRINKRKLKSWRMVGNSGLFIVGGKSTRSCGGFQLVNKANFLIVNFTIKMSFTIKISDEEADVDTQFLYK